MRRETSTVSTPVVHSGSNVGKKTLHLRTVGKAVAGDDLAVFGHNGQPGALGKGQQPRTVAGKAFAFAASFSFQIGAGFS